MDLGKAKLLRTGLNTLHQAVHPVHGIAWTDGRQVCLTSLCLAGGQARFGDTNVIGQFEHVLGLSWGPLCCTGAPALLAVQHKKHVTVWQLQLSALEHNKLLCTQTCEMSEPFPLLSQGCVWHPGQDVLAVLTKRDASVLFSVRADNRRVRADVRGGGLIHCACWTGDGARLVVAVGSALHSYIWSDVQKSLVACSFCPVFDVGGYVCALEATGAAQVAVATELPLDKLCGLNAGLAFELPADAEAGDGGDPRRRSLELERSYASPGNGPIDLTHLLSRHRRSDPSPLLHLRRRDTVTGSGQDSSHLILVSYEHKVTTTRKVTVPGILVPDIVALDPRGSTVAVASNTCSMVLVYRVTASAMPNVQQVCLGGGERPKGVCFLGDKTLLVMVGRQKAGDPAFLPSSNTDKYALRLVAQDLVCDEDGPGAAACHPEPPESFPAGARRHSEQLATRDREPAEIRDLVLPGGGLVGGRSPGSRRRLVEVVRSPEPSPVASSVDFSDRGSDRANSSSSSLAVEGLDLDPHGGRGGGWGGCPPAAGPVSKESSRASSPRPDRAHMDATLPISERASGAAKERTLQQLVLNMDRLCTRFADVQQCMAGVTDYAHNGKKAQSAYPNACEPPYANVTCQKQLSENVFIDERRPVLLCEGKLCLQVLQDLFNISVVEMMHGPLWVVLVADANGFVPLTFKPKDELTVRNGKRKSSLRTPGSPESSCPPSPVFKSRPSSTTNPDIAPEPST